MVEVGESGGPTIESMPWERPHSATVSNSSVGDLVVVDEVGKSEAYVAFPRAFVYLVVYDSGNSPYWFSVAVGHP